MKVVVAPDSFKESLSAVGVADALAAGIRDALPDAAVECLPLADGGEGTAAAMMAALGGCQRHCLVHGPTGERLSASYVMLGDGRTAVVEMAAAAGLSLVPPERRNPTRTTTCGVGELILRAAQDGARRIIVGLGGSGTIDGGIGAARAVGVEFDLGSPRGPAGPLCGAHLGRITHLRLSPRHRLIGECEIVGACDVRNVLCGPDGAARVFGPQKGATPRQVAQLDKGLHHLAEVIRADAGTAVHELPGGGAAGGLGAGLAAFFGATLVPGAELVIQAVGLRERIADADLVITGEGCLDRQSAMGKVISGVSAAARATGKPLVALVGSLGPGAEEAAELVDACFPILDRPMTLRQARARTAELLRRAAGQTVRCWHAARRRN